MRVLIGPGRTQAVADDRARPRSGGAGRGAALGPRAAGGAGRGERAAAGRSDAEGAAAYVLRTTARDGAGARRPAPPSLPPADAEVTIHDGRTVIPMVSAQARAGLPGGRGAAGDEDRVERARLVAASRRRRSQAARLWESQASGSGHARRAHRPAQPTRASPACSPASWRVRKRTGASLAVCVVDMDGLGGHNVQSHAERRPGAAARRRMLLPRRALLRLTSAASAATRSRWCCRAWRRDRGDPGQPAGGGRSPRRRTGARRERVGRRRLLPPARRRARRNSCGWRGPRWREAQAGRRRPDRAHSRRPPAPSPGARPRRRAAAAARTARAASEVRRPAGRRAGSRRRARRAAAAGRYAYGLDESEGCGSRRRRSPGRRVRRVDPRPARAPGGAPAGDADPAHGRRVRPGRRAHLPAGAGRALAGSGEAGGEVDADCLRALERLLGRT